MTPLTIISIVLLLSAFCCAVGEPARTMKATVIVNKYGHDFAPVSCMVEEGAGTGLSRLLFEQRGEFELKKLLIAPGRGKVAVPAKSFSMVYHRTLMALSLLGLRVFEESPWQSRQ